MTVTLLTTLSVYMDNENITINATHVTVTICELDDTS